MTMNTNQIVLEILKFALANISERVGKVEMIDDVQFNEQTGTLYVNHAGNNCITVTINVSGN